MCSWCHGRVDLLPAGNSVYLLLGSDPREPGGGGTLCTRGVPPEGTLLRCEISTLRDKGSCDQLFDLRTCFDLLWDEGEDAILSVDDSLGVFPQNWLPSLLSYTGLLKVAGFLLWRNCPEFV